MVVAWANPSNGEGKDEKPVGRRQDESVVLQNDGGIGKKIPAQKVALRSLNSERGGNPSAHQYRGLSEIDATKGYLYYLKGGVLI